MNVFVATLLRLSYSGGFVILGVMILRLLLRGVPKQRSSFRAVCVQHRTGA